MILLRLLTAGSTLSGIKSRPSPYKMRQENLLPNFGQEKAGETPQERPPQPPPEPCIAPEYEKPARRPTLPAWRARRASKQPVRESAPVVAPTPRAKQTDEVSVTQPARKMPLKPKSKRPGGLLQRLSRMKNPFRPKSTARKAAAPVQGELRLDSVRVVRNDLNETDLEVIPAADAVDEADALPPVPTANAESGRLAWRRVASRLFGAGRT